MTFNRSICYSSLLLYLLLSWSVTDAQICINKYASIKFTASTYDSFTRSIVAPNKEILSVGRLYDYNSAAHIAKYSEQGNPIWSYSYFLNYYDRVKAIYFKAVNISDMIATPDGGYLIAGNVEQVISPYGLPPPIKNWALMAKLDKFGAVKWNKLISGAGDLSFSTVLLTNDGDYIAYLATDNGEKATSGNPSYGKVLRVGSTGTIKWSTFLYTFQFNAGGLGIKNKRGLLQAKNNNIVIADVVHRTDGVATQEGHLHFLELNYANGNVNWESSYEYPAPAYDRYFLPDFLNIKELPGGQFSFITNLYLPGTPGTTLVKKAVDIITNNKGIINKVVAFSAADGSASCTRDATIDANSGNQSLLIDNNGKTSINSIAAGGIISSTKGYTLPPGPVPANCFSSGARGYNIFFSNNRSLQFHLLMTDPASVIPCANTDATIVATNEVLNTNAGAVTTSLQYHFDDYYDYAYPLKRDEEYPMTKTTDCQETLDCCTDIIDKININNIRICEKTNYMLPDSTVIQDSGLYYVKFKTALGCDSIKYYRVDIDKSLAALNTGADSCLTGTSRITLSATPGYEKYYWMNSTLASGNEYVITTPGNYFVQVINACGSKSDSIDIFDQCEYEIYMPSAFTPNEDRLNDVFRISPLNKNKLISFSIFNRYGTLIYQTTNPTSGWNGKFKNQAAEPGTYVYYVEMMGFSGKRISQKGTVLLIR